MLRFSQNNGMDMSVLERQRAIFQQQQQQQYSDQWQSQENNLVIDSKAMMLHKFDQSHLPADMINSRVMPNIFGGMAYPGMANNALDNMDNYPCYSAAASNTSSMTGLTMSRPEPLCASTSISKKRKAEFEAEEDCKDKGSEGETAQIQSEITAKTERETSNNSSKGSSKVSEDQKPDYIHVRARRGQATDSHSLAERARREKISKKMKCLQDLVPGCNKVTGKAGMLDEIINYVQSLQKQVEFLSMKLAALNPRLDFNMDNFLEKEIPAYIASLPAAAASQLEMGNLALLQYSQMQQRVKTFEQNLAISPSQMVASKAGETSSMHIPEMFLDSSCVPLLQQISSCDPDWQNLFNTGFP